MEIAPARLISLGDVPIRRALPRQGRRTVGAWCFCDHLGPFEATGSQGMRVGPHPHIGLQTVTWLLSGEVVHTDSLGTEQTIRPGQLNLMTAGRGVAHAEETRASGGRSTEPSCGWPDPNPPDMVRPPSSSDATCRSSISARYR